MTKYLDINDLDLEWDDEEQAVLLNGEPLDFLAKSSRYVYHKKGLPFVVKVDLDDGTQNRREFDFWDYIPDDDKQFFATSHAYLDDIGTHTYRQWWDGKEKKRKVTAHIQEFVEGSEDNTYMGKHWDQYNQVRSRNGVTDPGGAQFKVTKDGNIKIVDYGFNNPTWYYS